MADIKWIKITTDIFDDEKFAIIDALPEADAIELMWFKLLVFAGKSNNNGLFFFNDRVAYTDEMLANIFRRNVNIVRLAMKTFVDLGMVEEIDGVYSITNWEKHQSLDLYEKRKEQERLASKKYREKKKQEVIEMKETSASYDASSKNICFCSYSISNSISNSYSLSNSNVNNLKNILSNKEYIENSKYKEYLLRITDNEPLLDVLYEWLAYKDDKKPKKQNHYQEISLNSLVKKFIEMFDENGFSYVSGCVENTITNGYVGIVWKEVRNSKPFVNNKRTQNDEWADA